jgi:alpha-L-glutamate ligase-like protein/uncharacterized protein (TIGR02421 family)
MNFFKNLFSNKGVLGINARNVLYLRPFNPKKSIRFADNKIKSKKFLATRGIPVPKLYQSIANRKELENFNFNALPSSFVLKPNKGYGGEGIIPIIKKKANKFLTISENELNKQHLEDHILDILDGRFSLNNTKDKAFFEQLIVSDERIGKFAYKGLPDIRIIVHNLVPIMAMLRLPTKESQGKANLHMGAIGVGIDIAKGQATYSTYKNEIIEEIPEKGSIKGLKIPYWEEILIIASRIQLITNLGYLAADICIDKNSGPVLLEINARAGLGVQIANMAPLRNRLEQVGKIKITNPTKGVRVAKDLFGNVLEKEIKQISGKTVIKPIENIEIIKKNEVIKTSAQIDITRKKSRISRRYAEKIGLITKNKDSETLKIKFSLKGNRIITVMDIFDIEKEYDFIIGRQDLHNFLIEPSIISKKESTPAIIKKSDKELTNLSLEQIDQILFDADYKAKVINFIRPIKIGVHKRKYLNEDNYGPKIKYKEIPFNPIEEIEILEKIKFEEDDLSQIFKEKKDEIVLKLKLLEARSTPEFTEISKKLYGYPTLDEIENAKKILKDNQNKKIDENEHLLNFEETKKILEETLNKYGLYEWRIVAKRNIVSSCSIKKNKIILLKENAFFSRLKIEKLIAHEIETHLLTTENGSKQPYKIFQYGLKDYLKIQEGLAIYNVEKKLLLLFEENTKIAQLIVAMSMPDKTLLEIAEILEKEYGVDKRNAIGTAIKVKRGVGDENAKGVFTKDYLYYSGYKEIKKFLENGGDLKDLYLGKVNLEQIEKIKKMPFIQNPKHIPDWY